MIFQKPLLCACPQVVPIQICPILLVWFVLERPLCCYQEPQPCIQLGEGKGKSDVQSCFWDQNKATKWSFTWIEIFFYFFIFLIIFCKGMDQTKCVVGSISKAGTPWPVLCLWTLPCTYSPNPMCVFCRSQGCICDFKPHLSRVYQELFKDIWVTASFLRDLWEAELFWAEGRTTAFSPPVCLAATRGDPGLFWP